MNFIDKQGFFTTHKGDKIKGEQLQKALDAVCDDETDNAYAILEEDAYASHVTTEKKKEYFNKHLEYAEKIRGGVVSNFTAWQRVNQKLTGECVGLLGNGE